METHKSMRAVYDYEANYVNAARYWMTIHQAAVCLRQKALEEKGFEKSEVYDVWAIIVVRYGLRVTGIRSEFYKLVAKDLVYAKPFLSNLEQRNNMPALDDLVEPMEKIDYHTSTQLMKALNTLSASNATKSSKGELRRRKLLAIGICRPLWRGTQDYVECWRQLGCSNFLCRGIQFGVYNPPSIPFVPGRGMMMYDIPQYVHDKAFAHKDLEEVCWTVIYKDVTDSYAVKAIERGAVKSSAFVVWQGSEEKKELEKRVSLDGVLVLICNGNPERRQLHIIRYVQGIQAFALGSHNEGLVSVSIRQPILPGHCTAIRLGEISLVVHTQLMSPFVKRLREKGFRFMT